MRTLRILFMRNGASRGYTLSKAFIQLDLLAKGNLMTRRPWENIVCALLLLFAIFMTPGCGSVEEVTTDIGQGIEDVAEGAVNVVYATLFVGFVLVYVVVNSPVYLVEAIAYPFTFEAQVYDPISEFPGNPYERSDEEQEKIAAARAKCLALLHEDSETAHEEQWMIWNVLGEYPSAEHMNISRISPDGRYVAVTNKKMILLTDMTTGEIQTLKGHRSWVTSLAFDPASSRLLSGDDGGFYHIWNPVTAKSDLYEHVSSHAMSAIALHPNGKMLLFCDTRSSMLEQYPLFPDHKDVLLQPEEFECQEDVDLFPAWALAVRPDGKRAITGHEDGLLVEWDIKTKKMVLSYKSKLAEILEARYTADDESVIFTVAGDKKEYLWTPGSKTHTLYDPKQGGVVPVVVAEPVVE